MFLRAVALVFMFLVQGIFPSRLSLSQVIRNRYGDIIIKLARKFEKVDFKHRKAALLQFCVANQSLRRLQAYQNCLNYLLLAEINRNKKNLEILVN